MRLYQGLATLATGVALATALSGCGGNNVDNQRDNTALDDRLPEQKHQVKSVLSESSTYEIERAEAKEWHKNLTNGTYPEGHLELLDKVYDEWNDALVAGLREGNTEGAAASLYNMMNTYVSQGVKVPEKDFNQLMAYVDNIAPRLKRLEETGKINEKRARGVNVYDLYNMLESVNSMK